MQPSQKKLCYLKASGANLITTYRLLNNVKEYREAFADFKAMRKKFDGVKVWFAQKNETLLDKLKAKWQPVAVTFESDANSNQLPDISVWNSSCLILSERARSILEPLVRSKGEFLALQDNYTLFNCLDCVGGDAISPEGSSFEMVTEASLHIPKTLVLLDDKIAGRTLFKPGFAHNSFLIFQDDFKNAVQENELGGIVFESNLARIFL